MVVVGLNRRGMNRTRDHRESIITLSCINAQSTKFGDNGGDPVGFFLSDESDAGNRCRTFSKYGYRCEGLRCIGNLTEIGRYPMKRCTCNRDRRIVDYDLGAHCGKDIYKADISL
jgi:hypothetical protein